jgi:chemotaxis protein methyltransferase CheR
MELTADDIGRFKDLVYRRSHLFFPASREGQLHRWIKQRAAQGGYRSADAYYQALSSDREEFEQLIGLITTRETYFFRMPGHFSALDKVVLPEISGREGKKALTALSRKSPYRMRLRAWSAGCATGQETYSLSMQLLESLRYPKAWDLHVLGTDINSDALETARAGRYHAARLENIPSRSVERYFTASGTQELSVAPAVREITEFRAVNLRNLPDLPDFKNAFDIIFCRNVMIYFDLPAQQRLVSALWDCLKPGGYLFTGEGEVLHLYTHSFVLREEGTSVFYQRPAEDGHPVSAGIS